MLFLAGLYVGVNILLAHLAWYGFPGASLEFQADARRIFMRLSRGSHDFRLCDSAGDLVAVIIFLPIVLAYTAWVFRVLKGRITLEELRRHTGVY